MKVPQPDLNKTLVDKFVAKTGANRKLSRLWGYRYVDGVRVLHARRHYFKASARPDNYERLFKYLKVWNDVKDYKGDGVKSAWFTLNKSNGLEDRSVSDSFISDNLNRMWWDDADGEMPDNLTLTTTVVISDGFNSDSNIEAVDWNQSKEANIQYIVDNYESFWSRYKIVQEGIGVINKGSVLDTELNIEVPDDDDLSPDDPWLSIISRYALRDSGVPCTIKDLEVGMNLAGGRVRTTMVVTLEIPYIEFSNSSSMVNKIAEDLKVPPAPINPSIKGLHGIIDNLSNRVDGFSTSNAHLTQRAAKTITYYETEDDIDVTTISRSYLRWEESTVSVSVYENFWHESNGIWYFKADVIDNPKDYGTNHVDLNNYLFSLLDTGYKKEKVPIWKKIVAIVIFVIAVVLTYLSFGTSSGATTPIMAAAYAIITGSLVVSLLSVLFSSLGMNEFGMAFSNVNREVAPLVNVASIILVVNIITAAANAVAAQVAKEGATQAIQSIVADLAADFATGLTDLLSGEITAKAVAVLNKTVSAYTKVQIDKLENISDRNIDLKAQYDKIVEETSMDSDVMKSYMNIYAKPATADWSIFASTYDLPYERGGGNLSTGNIQKTTKQAIRKADFEEAMFEDMIFV